MGRCVSAVDFGEKFDNIVFADPGSAASKIRQQLVGRPVLSTHRHGKQLWIRFGPCASSATTLIDVNIHFGMSGAIRIKGEDSVRYKRSANEAADDVPAWPPRYSKLLLKFKQMPRKPRKPRKPTKKRRRVDDCEAVVVEMCFSCARRFGRVRLRDDVSDSDITASLGFDALHGVPQTDVFCQAVRKTRKPVKALLLDQSFSAGVGNWIADEVLFQARVHPESRCDALDVADIERIREKLIHVVSTACAADADYEKFPSDWLFHYRWGKGSAAKSIYEPTKKPIKFLRVGGRTSAVVTAIQGRPKKRSRK